MKSKLGVTFALIYVALCVLLIATQGLFGESFITLILGLPWSMAFAYFEYGSVSGALVYVFVLAPLVLNTVILYWIGSLIGRNKSTPTL